MRRGWWAFAVGIILMLAGGSVLLAYFPHNNHWCTLAGNPPGVQSTFRRCLEKGGAAIIGAAILAGGFVVVLTSIAVMLAVALRRGRRRSQAD